MYRKTYLEVDCNILKNNIINIKKNYPEYKYYIGVVKANAYGHGGFVINSLIDGGINYFAVSSLEEALKLRTFNASVPILILEPVHIEDVNVCLENNITITVSSFEFFNKLLALDLPGVLKFHLKLDTGMSRLGFNVPAEVESVFKNVHKNSNLFFEGIFTHFATSGINDKHWDDQLEHFKVLTSAVDLSSVPIVHLGRSLTLVNHPKIPFCTGIRLGIAMYGMSQSMPRGRGLRSFLRELRNKSKRKRLNISSTTTTNSLELQTAITLYSEVMEIRKIHKDDFVGYGASFIAHSDEMIATIPIGYADGIPANIKHVSINGKLYNVVGATCMDMICVCVDSSVKLHDKVILIGGPLLSPKKVANECGIRTYTLFTNIRNRVPRVYKEGSTYTEINY